MSESIRTVVKTFYVLVNDKTGKYETALGGKTGDIRSAEHFASRQTAERARRCYWPKHAEKLRVVSVLYSATYEWEMP